MTLGGFTINVSGVARRELGAHEESAHVLHEKNALKGLIHADIGVERLVKNKYYHI
jgi:hypothetical protein